MKEGKTMKKTIAFILAMAMICSVVPAFAVEDVMGGKTVTGAVYYFGYDENEKKLHNAEAIEINNINYTQSPKVNMGKIDESPFLEKGDVLKYEINDNSINGNYEVLYALAFDDSAAASMTFTVVHNNKQTTVTKTKDDLEKDSEGKIIGKWVSLGYFDFAGNGDEYIIHKNDGQGKTYVTLLKIVELKSDVALTNDNTISLAVYKNGSERPDVVNVCEETLVEDAPEGNCKLTTDWEFSDVNMGPMKQAPNGAWVTPSNETKVTYEPGISGEADVYAYVFKGYGDVTYTIKDTKITLQPQKITQDQWVYLGNYDFSAGGNVTLNAASVENISASTVMFETDGTKRQYVTPVCDIGSEQKKPTQDIFIDMVEGDADHWAKTDVEYMASKKMINGVKDKYFDPEARITRAEYITILDRALGFEELSSDEKKVEEQPYDDVILNAWYAPYINYAKKIGLLDGFPLEVETEFKPNQPITREEMGLVTYNAIKTIGKNVDWIESFPDKWDTFPDVGDVNQKTEKGLKTLVQIGILKGVADEWGVVTISPKANATRAQGAVILKRFMEMFVWAGPTTDKQWKFDAEGSSEFSEDSIDTSMMGIDGKISVKEGEIHLDDGKAHVKKGASGYAYWEIRYKVNEEKPGIITSFGLADENGNEVVAIDWRYFRTLNFHNYEEKNNAKSTKTTQEYDLSENYHTFGLELDGDTIHFYMDGQKLADKKLTNMPKTLCPMFSVKPLDTINKQNVTMQVDYVRLWKIAE